jgi:hypothetical protein
MKTFHQNKTWRRFRLNIKDTNLEISANINSMDDSHDAVYELQQAIINVFRIHHARTMAGPPKMEHPSEHRGVPLNGQFKHRNGFGDMLS